MSQKDLHCKYLACTLKSGHPDGFCILHDPDPEKDFHMFQETVHKIQEAAPKGKVINLAGVIFPPNWSMQKWKETTSLDRIVYLHKATFQGEVGFDHDWFEGSNFGYATFEKKVTFSQCGIEGNLSFDYANFKEGILFDDAAFHHITFDHTLFQKEVTVGNDSSLTVHFMEVVSFENATFQEEVSFTNTIFHKGVTFKNALFKEKFFLIPTHLKFLTENLNTTKIPPETGEVNFDGAQFQQEASFDNLIFKAEASFRKTIFMKETSFNNTEFQEKADFNGAKFEAEVSFDETDFKSEVSIGAQFKFRALFRGKKEAPLFAKSGTVDLTNAIFYRPDLIRFSQADFSCCKLFETNVRGIDFASVEWADSISGCWIWDQLCQRELSRSVLYKPGTDLCRINGPDCLSSFGNFLWMRLSRKGIYEPTDKKPEELENAYRQIRQSYEDHRNYPEAGIFYFGEMANKRKRHSPIRQYLSLIGLYSILSGYGQKPIRAGIWLMVFLFGFSALFIGAGMEMGTAYRKPVSFFDFGTVLWAYTLNVVTFKSPLYFTPDSKCAEFLTLLARILVPIQAALFVLAVNRKFKR